jgi:hypothetical protein
VSFRAFLTRSSGSASVRSGDVCAGIAIGPRRKRSLDDVGNLDWQHNPTPNAIREPELRRRISIAVWRALAEPAFARALLADPTILLGGTGCTPQQRLGLERLRAPTIKEFVRQAESTFWTTPQPAESAPGQAIRVTGLTG